MEVNAKYIAYCGSKSNKFEKKNASKPNKWDKLKPLLNYPLNSIQFCLFQLKQAETKRALETCCNDRSF